MKRFYEAPNAQVIDLAAMESIALLDGHPDEGVAAAKDDGTFNPGSFGGVQGEPDF